MTRVTVNKEQRLYVIPEAYGYSCLGFEVCKQIVEALETELHKTFDRPIDKLPRAGSLKLYYLYRALCDYCQMKNTTCGWRSETQLTKRLIGLEGKRVEVISKSGNKRRFYVSRSSGYIPCHIEISTRRSDGGPAAYIGPNDEMRVVGVR